MNKFVKFTNHEHYPIYILANSIYDVCANTARLGSIINGGKYCVQESLEEVVKKVEEAIYNKGDDLN